MEIKIDRIFSRRIKDLSLADVKFGISKGWMDAGVAVDVALKGLKSNEYSEIEVELAALDYTNTYDIEDKLDELKVSSEDIKKDKWLKIVMTWLYEHRSYFEDPLQLVEEIYADFDYPESIAYLVRYMPSEGPIKDLLSEWKTYLENEVYSKLVEPLKIQQ